MSSALACGSRGRAHAVRALLRSRRARRRPTLFQIYATVMFGAIFGALAGNAIAAAIGGSLDAHKLLVYGPPMLLLLLLALLRFGTWQGPVSFSAADVTLLLTAPIALADLVRPKLDQGLAVGAVAGAVLGGLALMLMSGGPESVGLARGVASVFGCACFGVLGAAASWLVQSSRRSPGLVRRASPAVLLLAGALLVAASDASAGRLVGTWSGPWGWLIAPLAGSAGWPVATGLLVAAAAAAATFARARSGAATMEQFQVRADTRSALGASALLIDYRAAGLTYRAALPGGGVARLSRVPRPRSPRLVVLWRDALALIRNPFRIAWAGLLGAAGTYEVVAHPGNAVPAGVGAVALYFAAALLCEPLRVDVDAPDRSGLLLSWPFARVLLAHCALPAFVLFTVVAATVVGAVLAGAIGIAALALIPTVLVAVVGVAVLCAALSARRGGRLDTALVTRVLTVDPSNPGGAALLAVWLAPWLLIDIGVVGAAALIIGRAARHSAAPLGAVGLALILCGFVATVLLGIARSSTPPE